MKTINEIMAEVKNISDNINELCSNIDELRHADKSQNQFDSNKLKANAKRYPITGHPIYKVDSYTQKLYLILLASITQLDNTDVSIVENNMLFISRIIEGINTDFQIEEIFKNALELDEKIIDEFTLSIIENKLSMNFAVDSVIIANLSGKCGDKILEYLSILFEMLKISKEQVRDIVKLGILILERDKKGYKEFCCRELSIKLEDFFFYILDFYDGIISNNSELFHFEYTILKNMDRENNAADMDIIKSKNVVLKNICIKEAEKLPTLSNCESVIIDNCTFEKNKVHLKFEECKNVLVQNSTFKELKNRALHFSKGSDLKIISSIFESCQHRSDEKYSYGYQAPGCGGAMYVSNIKKFVIDNCIFDDCNTYQSEKGNADGAVAYVYGVSKFELSNSSFKYCNNYSWRYSNHWDKVGALFEIEKTESTKAINCTRKDSAKNGIENSLFVSSTW